MKKIGKRLVFAAVMVILTIGLNACIFGWTEKDAEEYVQGVLDIICTGKTDVDITFDDVSEENYESTRKEAFDEAADTCLKEIESNGFEVSDEMKEKLRQFVDDAFLNASYEVGKATKKEDKFKVPVTIHPLIAMDDGDMKEFKEIIEKNVRDGKMETDDDKKLFEQIVTAEIEMATSNLKKQSYGEDYDMIMTLEKDSEGVYQISEDDSKEFGENLSIMVPLCEFEFDWSEKDAENHVQGVLDILCTGKTDVDVVFEDLEEEDYESFHKEIIDGITDEMVNAEDIDEYDLSDEIIEGYRKVFDRALAAASFEVGKAAREEDSFKVPVTIHPLIFLTNEDVEKVTDIVSEEVQNGELDSSDNTALYDRFFTLQLEAINSNLDEPTYAEDHEMTMLVFKNKDDIYETADENVTEFEENILIIDVE